MIIQKPLDFPNSLYVRLSLICWPHKTNSSLFSLFDSRHHLLLFYKHSNLLLFQSSSSSSFTVLHRLLQILITNKTNSISSMEIPVISRMSDLEDTITSLNSPPRFFYRILSLFELGKSSQSHGILKWAALFIALIYTFSNIASRFKILILQHYCKSNVLASLSNPLTADLDDDVSSSDDDEDDDDETCSSCSSEEDGEEEMQQDSRVADNSRSNYRVYAGQNGKLRRRGRGGFGEGLSSLSELLTCNGVVKLWDETFCDRDDTISIVGVDWNSENGSVSGKIPAVGVPSGAIVSTVSNSHGNVGVNLWDMRNWRRVPAVNAEWKMRRQCQSVVVGVGAGGVENIYVCNEVAGEEEFVGDMRKVNSPLQDLTECEERSRWWWDADAVNR
ncbi:hypothetical protein Dimus_031133 [Dionaea muscipula]